MRRFHILILLVCLLASWPAYAQEISGQAGGASLTVKENDNNPTVSGVGSISFTNGTVTDDGAGAVSVTIGGREFPRLQR